MQNAEQLNITAIFWKRCNGCQNSREEDWLEKEKKYLLPEQRPEHLGTLAMEKLWDLGRDLFVYPHLFFRLGALRPRFVPKAKRKFLRSTLYSMNNLRGPKLGLCWRNVRSNVLTSGGLSQTRNKLMY